MSTSEIDDQLATLEKITDGTVAYEAVNLEDNADETVTYENITYLEMLKYNLEYS